MPDVIAAPQHDIIAYRHKRLNGVVFEDEAVVAAFEAGPCGRLRADVANQPVAPTLSVVIFFRPNMVHLLEAHGYEHVILIGRITFPLLQTR